MSSPTGISRCIPQSWRQVWNEKLKSPFHKYVEPILKIALKILFIASSLVVFYLNPNFFVLGVISAVVFPDHMERVIEKVKDVFSKNQWILSVFIGITCVVVALPQGLAMGSALWGAYVGLQLMQGTTDSSKVN